MKLGYKLMLPALALCLINPLQVYAETKIKGEVTDNLEINASDKYFSKKEILTPGDIWKSSITVENTGDYDYDISLDSIESNTEDTSLHNIVEVVIKHGDDIIFDGPLSSEVKEKWITVKAHDKIEYNLEFTAPTEMSNELQGKKLDSKFVFEARIEEIPVVESGEDDTGISKTVKTSDDNKIDNYIFLSMLGVTGIFTSIHLVLKNKKKEDK